MGFGWSWGREGVGGAGALRLGVVDATDKWLADVAGWALFREHWNCLFCLIWTASQGRLASEDALAVLTHLR